MSSYYKQKWLKLSLANSLIYSSSETFPASFSGAFNIPLIKRYKAETELIKPTVKVWFAAQTHATLWLKRIWKKKKEEEEEEEENRKAEKHTHFATKNWNWFWFLWTQPFLAILQQTDSCENLSTSIAGSRYSFLLKPPISPPSTVLGGNNQDNTTPLGKKGSRKKRKEGKKASEKQGEQKTQAGKESVRKNATEIRKQFNAWNRESRRQCDVKNKMSKSRSTQEHTELLWSKSKVKLVLASSQIVSLGWIFISFHKPTLCSIKLCMIFFTVHVYVSIWGGSGQVSVGNCTAVQLFLFVAFLACKSIRARHCEHALFCMDFFVPFINFH